MHIPAHGISKGKIGVLIEDHFDMTEFRIFNKRIPEAGYDLIYMSDLWNNSSLQFGSNPDNGWVEEHVTVTVDVKDISPSDYSGFLLIGAYATDRLRYQVNPQPGKPNEAPSVNLMREANVTPGVKIGTICHSLWLLCADKELLKDKKVTCAHNIICDVENAGAIVQYDNDGTVGCVVDGDLITAKHPAFTDQLIDTLLAELV